MRQTKTSTKAGAASDSISQRSTRRSLRKAAAWLSSKEIVAGAVGALMAGSLFVRQQSRVGNAQAERDGVTVCRHRLEADAVRRHAQRDRVAAAEIDLDTHRVALKHASDNAAIETIQA